MEDIYKVLGIPEEHAEAFLRGLSCGLILGSCWYRATEKYFSFGPKRVTREAVKFCREKKRADLPGFKDGLSEEQIGFLLQSMERNARLFMNAI